MWAFPRENSFKVRMRDIRGNYDKYLKMANELKEYNLNKFTEEYIYKMYAESIYGEPIKRVEIKDLPKVSILTSVYGSAEYLESCLQNIVDQTVFAEKCEVLLGHPTASPDFDKEREIILKFVEKYPHNFFYYVLDGDPNLYTTWNYLIELANGSILTNFNTDDRRSKDNVEKCLKLLYSNPDACGVYYDQYITDKFNEDMETNSSGGRKYNFPEFSWGYLKLMNFVMHAMSFWRKDLHTKYGKFNDKYKSAADWCAALEWCSHGEKFVKHSEVLGLYCFNSVSGISTCEAKSESKRLEEKEVYEKFKDVNL
jgi:cellulose synthase/poly-beta-1,6-N-acetylglucosamine synthase-like glycosyltransferase